MEIQKDIPVPPARSRGYPFAEMAVGDSVFFADCDSYCKEYSAARVYGHRSGKKFSARTDRDGLRVWRVK